MQNVIFNYKKAEIRKKTQMSEDTVAIAWPLSFDISNCHVIQGEHFFPKKDIRYHKENYLTYWTCVYNHINILDTLPRWKYHFYQPRAQQFKRGSIYSL